jgi:hypothetical protein
MSVQLSAAQAVAEHFQSPDDLQKLAAFRQKLEKEKASIDAKLKSGVKDQLDATKDGLRKLFSTRASLQSIKDEMVTLDKMGRESQGQIATFDQIAAVCMIYLFLEYILVISLNQVSAVHRNFAQTEEMVNNLLDMDDKLVNLEYMLDVDSRDPQGPNENLLFLHFQINQLEAFRNETTHMAKKASPDVRNNLQQYFARLNRLIDAFDSHILALARNILPLVRGGYSDVVVKLIKIAELELKEDEKVCTTRLPLASIFLRLRYRPLPSNCSRWLRRWTRPPSSDLYKLMLASSNYIDRRSCRRFEIR